MHSYMHTYTGPHAHTQIDDLKDRIVSGSEGSRAMREIRVRDPDFDMNNFVRAVKVGLSMLRTRCRT